MRIDDRQTISTYLRKVFNQNDFKFEFLFCIAVTFANYNYDNNC
jgi:hypothetical protein